MIRELKSVLVVAAHPDDVEIGCGGFLAKLFQKNPDCKVQILILTDGRHLGKSAQRVKEQRKAVGLMQRSGNVYLSSRSFQFQDTTLASVPLRDLVVVVENEIRENKPELVLTHFAEDTHQDHRVCSLAVTSAARFVPSVLGFQAYTSQNFHPTVFCVMDEDALVQKGLFLSCHASQVEAYQDSKFDMHETIETFAQYCGFLCKQKLAEGFVPQRLSFL